MTEPRTAPLVHDVKLHDEIEQPKAAKNPKDIQRGFIKDLGSVADPVGEILNIGSIK